MPTNIITSEIRGICPQCKGRGVHCSNCQGRGTILLEMKQVLESARYLADAHSVSRGGK